MEAIDKTLKWCQLLQTSCFGTPVSVTIEASKGIECDKMIYVSINAPGITYHYPIYSDMPTSVIYDTWGTIKADTSKLLEAFSCRKINKHGRERSEQSKEVNE